LGNFATLRVYKVIIIQGADVNLFASEGRQLYTDVASLFWQCHITFGITIYRYYTNMALVV